MIFSSIQGPRARGHVEPLVHRSGDVPQGRQERDPTPGDRHPAVSGDNPGIGGSFRMFVLFGMLILDFDFKFSLTFAHHTSFGADSSLYFT